MVDYPELYSCFGSAACASHAQIAGPHSRHVSADLAKAEVMEYLRMAKRRGHSLRQSKNDRLEQVHLRFLKQSGLLLAGH